MANPTAPLSGAEARQIEEIERAERALERDRGLAGRAYSALQAFHGDLFEEGSVVGGEGEGSSLGGLSSGGESEGGEGEESELGGR